MNNDVLTKQQKAKTLAKERNECRRNKVKQNIKAMGIEDPMPIAKTNILDIKTDVNTLLEKLCQPIDGTAHIDYVFKTVVPDSTTPWDTRAKQFHAEIKAVIAERTGLAKSIPFIYSSKVSSKGYLALFLAPKATDLSKLTEDANSLFINNTWLCKHLLDLHIKSHLINKPTIFGDDNIAQLNSEIFLGTINASYSPKNGHGTPGTIHDFLKLDTYLSEQLELNINLNKQVYFSPENAQPIGESVLKEEPLLFVGTKPKASYKKWDARKSNRNFMAFDAPARTTRELAPNKFNLFSNSITYYITYIQQCIKSIFEDLEITTSERHFTASHRIDIKDNITLHELPELTIIDARDIQTINSKHDQIINDYANKNSASIIKANKIENIASLPKDQPYLVINNAEKGENSIRDTAGKKYKDFTAALFASAKPKSPTFDFYTSLKIHNFNAKEKLITQGLDAPSKLNNEHTLERIKNELLIKKLCFQDKQCTLKTEANGHYHLISVRRTEYRKTLIAVTKVQVENNTLTINEQKVLTDSNFIEKTQFNSEYQTLRHILPNKPQDIFANLYDSSFIIYDPKTKQALISYSSKRVPSVIGNANFNNIELWHSRQPNEKTQFTQSAMQDKCVLPYYASRNKDFNTVFIEDNQHFVDYFITSHLAVNSTINKRNLTKRILVLDHDGNNQPILKNKLAELYFDSHCSKLIKNKAVAYKTLLQKIAEALLH